MPPVKRKYATTHHVWPRYAKRQRVYRKASRRRPTYRSRRPRATRFRRFHRRNVNNLKFTRTTGVPQYGIPFSSKTLNPAPYYHHKYEKPLLLMRRGWEANHFAVRQNWHLLLKQNPACSIISILNDFNNQTYQHSRPTDAHSFYDSGNILETRHVKQDFIPKGDRIYMTRIVLHVTITTTEPLLGPFRISCVGTKSQGAQALGTTDTHDIWNVNVDEAAQEDFRIFRTETIQPVTTTEGDANTGATRIERQLSIPINAWVKNNRPDQTYSANSWQVPLSARLWFIIDYNRHSLQAPELESPVYANVQLQKRIYFYHQVDKTE